MPNIGETSLVFASLADSVFHNHTVWLGASILTLPIACMIHHIRPMRLTRVLVTDMKETEKLYYDAVEAGELPRDAGTEEELLGLQKKVSEIREDSLHYVILTIIIEKDFKGNPDAHPSDLHQPRNSRVGHVPQEATQSLRSCTCLYPRFAIISSRFAVVMLLSV
ncbi:hypothetical protein C8J57DRAFT_1238735 [Mycena rebaudengoi]|nr:hypothetical protein C8J57DRAFT_1238735 [Mycena rebaudengoi]